MGPYQFYKIVSCQINCIFFCLYHSATNVKNCRFAGPQPENQALRVLIARQMNASDMLARLNGKFFNGDIKDGK